MILLIALLRMALIFINPHSSALIIKASDIIVCHSDKFIEKSVRRCAALNNKFTSAIEDSYNVCEDILIRFLPLFLIYSGLLVGSTVTYWYYGISYWLRYFYLELANGNRSIMEILRTPTCVPRSKYDYRIWSEQDDIKWRRALHKKEIVISEDWSSKTRALNATTSRAWQACLGYFGWYSYLSYYTFVLYSSAYSLPSAFFCTGLAISKSRHQRTGVGIGNHGLASIGHVNSRNKRGVAGGVDGVMTIERIIVAGDLQNLRHLVFPQGFSYHVLRQRMKRESRNLLSRRCSTWTPGQLASVTEEWNSSTRTQALSSVTIARMFPFATREICSSVNSLLSPLTT